MANRYFFSDPCGCGKSTLELMKARHSVRKYVDKKIEEEKREILQQFLEECNKQSGLHMQIVYDEPDCFDSFLAHYGSFEGVANYIALVGKKAEDLEETCGYFGEKMVLKAQELGLNTCWVALTYGKGKCKADVQPDEKLVCVISIGYGAVQGVQHKSKPMEQLCECDISMPDWFKMGMEGALLAPTAMNQQKFKVTLKEDKVQFRAGMGFYTKLDLGIVKCHFEMAAGRKCTGTKSK